MERSSVTQTLESAGLTKNVLMRALCARMTGEGELLDQVLERLEKLSSEVPAVKTLHQLFVMTKARTQGQDAQNLWLTMLEELQSGQQGRRPTREQHAVLTQAATLDMNSDVPVTHLSSCVHDKLVNIASSIVALHDVQAEGEEGADSGMDDDDVDVGWCVCI